MFGCCNSFNMSASSLNRARSALEYLSFKEKNGKLETFIKTLGVWPVLELTCQKTTMHLV